jgi:hypothetical protein
MPGPLLPKKPKWEALGKQGREQHRRSVFGRKSPSPVFDRPSAHRIKGVDIDLRQQCTTARNALSPMENAARDPRGQVRGRGCSRHRATPSAFASQSPATVASASSPTTRPASTMRHGLQAAEALVDFARAPGVALEGVFRRANFACRLRPSGLGTSINGHLCVPAPTERAPSYMGFWVTKGSGGAPGADVGEPALRPIYATPFDLGI